MNARGMVLFMTLIMMSLMITLVLSMQYAQIAYVQFSSKRMHHHRDFYQLERVAEQLQQTLFMHPLSHCTTQAHDANWALTSSWQIEACTMNAEQKLYQYLFEDLGITPCLVIKRPQGELSAQHWRLTVIDRHDRNYEGVQYHISLPSSSNTCPAITKNVPFGRLTWRHFKG